MLLAIASKVKKPIQLHIFTQTYINSCSLHFAQDTPPVPLHMDFFLFQVVNEDELATSDKNFKPELVAKGPYSYLEIREKWNKSSEDEAESWIRCVRSVSTFFLSKKCVKFST